MRLAIIGIGSDAAYQKRLDYPDLPNQLLYWINCHLCNGFDGQVPGVVLVHAEQRAGDSLQQDQVYVELNFSPAFSCPNS